MFLRYVGYYTTLFKKIYPFSKQQQKTKSRKKSLTFIELAFLEKMYLYWKSKITQ